MRNTLRVLLLSAAVAVLATGCQTIKSVTGLSHDDTPVPVSEVPPAPVLPPVTMPAKPAEPILKGMDSAAVLTLWGEPSIRRRDIGSELWTYKKSSSKCSLLLYLYPSGDGRMIVLKGESVPGGMDDAALSACARPNDLPLAKPVS